MPSAILSKTGKKLKLVNVGHVNPSDLGKKLEMILQDSMRH